MNKFLFLLIPLLCTTVALTNTDMTEKEIEQAQKNTTEEPSSVDTTTDEDREVTEAAITGFLNIAAGVAHIIQNPHNSHAIIQNTQGILNGILNIVAAATRNLNSELDQKTYLTLLTALEKELHELIVTKKKAQQA